MTEWKYEQDGLCILAAKTGSRALVSWRGVSDSRSPGTSLNPFLLGLAQQQARRVGHVAAGVEQGSTAQLGLQAVVLGGRDREPEAGVQVADRS